MMIIMRANATQNQIDAVISTLQLNGLRAHLSTGEERTVIGAIGDGRPVRVWTGSFRSPGHINWPPVNLSNKTAALPWMVSRLGGMKS
jgi:3-deoxy-7-phosphoheptulonate synthase